MMSVDSTDQTRKSGNGEKSVSAFRRIAPVINILNTLIASRLGILGASVYFVVVGFVFFLGHVDLGGVNILNFIVFEDIAMLAILAWAGPLALVLLLCIVLYLLLSGVSLVLEWLRGSGERPPKLFDKFEGLDYIALTPRSSVEGNTTNVAMKYAKLAGWVISNAAPTLVNLVILPVEACLRTGYRISLGCYELLRHLRAWIDGLVRSMSAGRVGDRALQRFPAPPRVSYLALTPLSSVEEDTTDVAMKYAKLGGWFVSNAAVTLVNFVILPIEAGLRAGYRVSLGCYEVLRHLRGWIDALVRSMSSGRVVDWASQRFPPLPAMSYLDLVPLSSVDTDTVNVAMKYSRITGWVVSNSAVTLVNFVVLLGEAGLRAGYRVSLACYEALRHLRGWIARLVRSMSAGRASDWTAQRFPALPTVSYLNLTPLSSVEGNSTDVAMKYAKLGGWIVSNSAVTLVNFVILLLEAGLRAGYRVSLACYEALRHLRGWIARLVRSMSAGRASEWAAQRFPALPAVSYLNLTPLSSVEGNTTDVAMKYAKLGGWIVSNAAVMIVNLVVGLFEAVLRLVYGVAFGLYEAWYEIRNWIDSFLSTAVKVVDETQTGLVFAAFLLPLMLALLTWVDEDKVTAFGYNLTIPHADALPLAGGESETGMLCTLQPLECYENSQLMASTRNYLFFRIGNKDGVGSNGTLGNDEASVFVILKDNLRCFEVAGKSPPNCKDPKENGGAVTLQTLAAGIHRTRQALDHYSWEILEDVGDVQRTVGEVGVEVRDTRESLGYHALQTAKDIGRVRVAVGDLGQAVATNIELTNAAVEGIEWTERAVTTNIDRTNAAVDGIEWTEWAVATNIGLTKTAVEGGERTERAVATNIELTNAAVEGIEQTEEAVATNIELTNAAIEGIEWTERAVATNIGLTKSAVEGGERTERAVAINIELTNAAVEGIEQTEEAVATNIELTNAAVEGIEWTEQAVATNIGLTKSAVEGGERTERAVAINIEFTNAAVEGIEQTEEAVATNIELTNAAVEGIEWTERAVATNIGLTKSAVEGGERTERAVAINIELTNAAVEGIEQTEEAVATNIELTNAAVEGIEWTERAVATNIGLTKAAIEGGERTERAVATNIELTNAAVEGIEQTEEAVATNIELTNAAVEGIEWTERAVATNIGLTNAAVEGIEQTEEAVATHIDELAVTERTVIDRTGGQNSYLFAGFDTTEYTLKDYHRRWLLAFYKVIRSCAKEEPGPHILVRGLASVEPYRAPIRQEFLNDQPDLCSPRTAQAERRNNCYLANQRLINVGGFLEHLTNDPKLLDDGVRVPANDSFRSETQSIAKELNEYCRAPEPRSFPTVSNHISLQPWCTIEEMEKFRVKYSDKSAVSDGPLHFLNRSAHIVIEDAGNCEWP